MDALCINVERIFTEQVMTAVLADDSEKTAVTDGTISRLPSDNKYRHSVQQLYRHSILKIKKKFTL
jgi:hypothetical protein